jgi:beta-lactamase regulating signal transducer with metallopeptidase domain
MPLFEIGVRTAVILLIAWLATRAMRRTAAATRHLVWTLAVVGALAVPIGTAVLPAWRILPNLSVEAGTVPPEGVLPLKGRSDEGNQHAPHLVVPSAFSGKIVRPVWIVMAWAVGALLLLARIVSGGAAVRRLARHARPADARWRALLDGASHTADIRRRVKLLVSRDIAVPMTWGGSRPMLLLPTDALEWTDDRARVVLLHELAHVRRADWLTHALGRVLAALHWFNPLAWIALAAMTRERERACDDFVLAHGAKPSEYAQHLLEIARQGVGRVQYAMAPAMARPTELEGRLLSILAPHRREPRRRHRVALTAAAVCTTLAAATTAPREEPPPPPPAVRLTSPPVTNWIRSNDDTPDEKRKASRLRAALQPLADTALTDESEDAREKATMALALRSGPDVVNPLLRALKDPSSQVREKAALGLALRRDPRVVDSLLEAASDPDSQVREKVAIALGLSGDARAVEALNRSLADPDPQVREKAASGLTLFLLSSRIRPNTP